MITRDRWIDRVRDDLEKALLEFASIKFMELTDPTEKDKHLIKYWNNETKRLLARSKDYFNLDQVNFSIQDAKTEAITEATSYLAIATAKQRVIDISSLKSIDLLSIFLKKQEEYTAENLLDEMILKYIEM